MDTTHAHDSHGHDHGHDDHHHELPFWKKYIWSTDHKVIGAQYGFCGLVLLLQIGRAHV